MLRGSLGCEVLWRGHRRAWHVAVAQLPISELLIGLLLCKVEVRTDLPAQSHA